MGDYSQLWKRCAKGYRKKWIGLGIIMRSMGAAQAATSQVLFDTQRMALGKQNAKVKELEAQIRRLQCCGNCDMSSMLNCKNNLKGQENVCKHWQERKLTE